MLKCNMSKYYFLCWSLDQIQYLKDEGWTIIREDCPELVGMKMSRKWNDVYARYIVEAETDDQKLCKKYLFYTYSERKFEHDEKGNLVDNGRDFVVLDFKQYKEVSVSEIIDIDSFLAKHYEGKPMIIYGRTDWDAQRKIRDALYSADIAVEDASGIYCTIDDFVSEKHKGYAYIGTAQGIDKRNIMSVNDWHTKCKDLDKPALLITFIHERNVNAIPQEILDGCSVYMLKDK